VSTNSTPIVEARGLGKRFGGTQAIAEVDLTLKRGEVHGLVGENGAGKSTLGRCVAGVLRPDQGSMLLDRESVEFRNPGEALDHGVAMVEQELSLVPAMSVTDNVLLGARRDRWRRRRGRTRTVAALCERFRLEVPVDARVEQLSAGDQQKVEILRALARGARLLVMDEPTARLDQDESRNLLRVIRQLADDGTTVVFVSHFLEDVLAVCDRVTVMRDGRVVKTCAADGETQASIVEAMIGRPAEFAFPHRKPPPGEPAPLLEVENLADGGRVVDVSLRVGVGEIVGLGGLVGSGRTEVAQMIFGAAPRAAGSIRFDGEDFAPRSVRDAIDAGISYLPESRKDTGLLLDLSSAENITLCGLDGVSRLGFIQRRGEIQGATEIMTRLSVSPLDPRMRVGALSGGNQQKVLFGKWLRAGPRLLIADEPTRGVDIGAKFAIYQLLGELADQGLAVLLISSEAEELLGLADRVVVLSRGRTVAELEGERLSEEHLLHAAFGGPAATREAAV
jgi:simple sugar transport system ATP-binding protein/ribose transport system ATP-binding protein